MGRPRIFSLPGEGNPGQEPHPINIGITEYDWLRLNEAVSLDPNHTTASSLVRSLIGKCLDEHPKADLIHEQAQAQLEFNIAREARHAQYRTQQNGL